MLYVLRRFLYLLIIMAAISIVAFIVIQLPPGDYVSAYISRLERAGMRGGVNAEMVDALRKSLGMDEPIHIQYVKWMWAMAKGDMGRSFAWRRPVSELIAERLPLTMAISLVSIIFVYLVAIPIGIYSALRRRKPDERAVTVVLFILYSMPSFWIGLLLLMFFTGDLFLDIFPVAGLKPDTYLTWGKSYWFLLGQTARHYVLPIVCLTYGGFAALSRYMRVGILEVIGQDYIRTARAKGLPEYKVVLKHVMRNSVIPMITIFAGLLPGLIAGSIVVEYIFSIPGMGSLSLSALASRDYPLLMALFTIGAVLSLLGILLSDLIYGLVDPRVSFE